MKHIARRVHTCIRHSQIRDNSVRDLQIKPSSCPHIPNLAREEHRHHDKTQRGRCAGGRARRLCATVPRQGKPVEAREPWVATPTWTAAAERHSVPGSTWRDHVGPSKPGPISSARPGWRPGCRAHGRTVPRAGATCTGLNQVTAAPKHVTLRLVRALHPAKAGNGHH